MQVFIAQSRSSCSHRDVEDEELTRIFVMIPKTFSEEDLKNTFKVRAAAFRISHLLTSSCSSSKKRVLTVCCVASGVRRH